MDRELATNCVKANVTNTVDVHKKLKGKDVFFTPRTYTRIPRLLSMKVVETRYHSTQVERLK